MDEFLEVLAQREYEYYHYFCYAKPQAYTSTDCFERIQKQAKYEEVLNLINFLPNEQQKIVNERVRELKG